MTLAAAPRASRLHAQLRRLTEALLNEFRGDHWEGELSSSALSTAVAVVALREMDRQNGAENHHPLISGGLDWLARNQNGDGGWGDTVRSKSNISTTALCRAAFAAAGDPEPFSSAIARAGKWLVNDAGSMQNLPRVIADRYGRDRTFSIPILMTLAISGLLGPDGWRTVPPLPFELAMLPRGFYGALNLPVVSYALPALIAIGQAIHHHAPSRNPFPKFARNFSRARTLRRLETLQPSNGGFLEATPLTAFVTMALASAGRGDHSVSRKAAAFLRASVRPDGSWPIDTNLAAWVTTLAVKALAGQPNSLGSEQRARICDWLTRQQTKSIHAYTGAAPGAWAWTDLPGGVPDADDTAGALLALALLGGPIPESAVEAGVTWLLNVQNRDGGIPTFCRGWANLPFDRSTPEITAHALRAWQSWHHCLNGSLQARVNRSAARAHRYLNSAQRPDGSFIPLWFGNEHAESESNPVYGTAQVLIALNEITAAGQNVPAHLLSRAAGFLKCAQNADGSWGGDKNSPPSLEESALAAEALAGFAPSDPQISASLDWMLESLERADFPSAAPIGLYFARLWYFERLYPLIFSVRALGKIAAPLSDRNSPRLLLRDSRIPMMRA